MAGKQRAAARDSASVEADDGDGFAPVEIPETDTKILTVACADCGTTVDRVEYDANATTPPAVMQVASALGLDEDAARALVAKQNPDALRTQEDNARALADAIVAGTVEGRPTEVDECPRGHGRNLEVK